mgnify:CR=1 FL=1
MKKHDNCPLEDEQDGFELDAGGRWPKLKAKGVVPAILTMCLLGVVCNISVVVLFLSFIERQVSHTDKVDDLRIKTCHDTAARGAAAMELMGKTFAEQTTEFQHMSRKLDTIHKHVEHQRYTFDQLLELERQQAREARERRR